MIFRFYNLIVFMIKNLIKEVEVFVKKLEVKIKFIVFKFYVECKVFNYKGLMENVIGMV